ncbi:P-type ATPase-metal cation transport, partial [human gut metagenome]
VAQELRAKDILEKLSVISMAQAKVLRNGEINEIPIDNIVLADCNSELVILNCFASSARLDE